MSCQELKNLCCTELKTGNINLTLEQLRKFATDTQRYQISCKKNFFSEHVIECWVKTLSFLMNVHYHKIIRSGTETKQGKREAASDEKSFETLHAKKGELIKKVFIVLIMFSLKISSRWAALPSYKTWHSWHKRQKEVSFLLKYNYIIW